MANGKFGGGNGQLNNPLLVEDVADLTAIRIRPNMSYQLANDINLGIPGFADAGWTPIDNFTGTLDGAGHKISNLYINLPDSINVGLFSSLEFNNREACKIHDLTVENASVRGRSNVGILAGYIKYGNYTWGNGNEDKAIFTRIHVTGTVSGNENIGGLIGHCYHKVSVRVESVLMTDISVDIRLIPNSYKTKAGLLIGASDGDNCTSKICRIVLKGKTTQESSNTNSFVTWSKTGLIEEKFEDCYYDADSWNGRVNDGMNPVATKDLFKKISYKALEDKNIKENKAIWNFDMNKMPCANSTSNNSFFLKKDNNFYVCKDDKWQAAITGELTSDCIEYGMSDLNSVSQNAWTKAKEEFGSFEIVDAVRTYGVIKTTKEKHTMNRDKNLEKSKAKQKYKKTFSFADLEQGIFCLESL